MSDTSSASGPCVDCQLLPVAPPESGILVVAPPLASSLASVGQQLESAGFSPRSEVPSTLSVPYGPGQLGALAECLEAAFSSIEQHDARVLVLPAGAPVDLPALLRMETLAGFLARARARWLVDLLAEHRATTWFQPVFTADGRLYAHECLLRGLERDGRTIIPPGVLYSAAAAGDLMFHLDRFARLLAIRNGAGVGRLFINFTPTAIYNPAFCLRSTVEAVREAGIPSELVVFEVVESQRIEDVRHLVRILDTYRAAGFGVALDDFGEGFASLNLLDQVRPDVVKLDIQLVRGIDANPYRATIVQRIVAMARDLGITTLAEGIETPDELRVVREAGVDLVQGYLLGRPAARPLPQGAFARAA
ncbi:EAL domain-containing protein [Tepidiforma thermophila]|uniref:EAL domain-containing protein (Putative c-di-GMP-specific phosphodiesterase class I) n=1 Tax=Tepidiforma thermophila (strain KCTC 52669 / CGMCC 1.13589 / G233) TaxID=2761530 RepID=A0A2A9HJW2_TEPT2|nr:EAL domain-containing protein [Tepidiforma thermophila]PFG75420.1 EAL domain-containing protein (putative c-di-GMP-specific phosphodiesterase class I) [Tepidiforma thermophila]